MICELLVTGVVIPERNILGHSVGPLIVSVMEWKKHVVVANSIILSLFVIFFLKNHLFIDITSYIVYNILSRFHNI